MTLVEQIEEQARICGRERVDSEDAKRRMDEIKARIAGDVASNPAFTTDARRDAELIIRLNQDADYLRVEQEYYDIEAERPEHEARLERLRNEFRLELLNRQLEIVKLRQGVGVHATAAATV